MKALPWILAGVAVGVCVILLLKLAEPQTESARPETGSSATPETDSATPETKSATPKTESAIGSDGVESVTPKKYGWGTKTLVGGKAG